VPGRRRKDALATAGVSTDWVKGVPLQRNGALLAAAAPVPRVL